MTSTSGQTTVADDTTTADAAYARLRRGTTLLWQGDFHNGRQLIRAVDRRLTKQAARKGKKKQSAGTAADLFLRQREDRARRAEILGRIVVDLAERDGQWLLDLHRAPDVAGACGHAYGAPSRGESRRTPFTALQGVLGAYQWHLNGVEVPALGEKVYPDYGVFSPTRSEYVDLVDDVAAAFLPSLNEGASVLELGTGTGVLAAVLARRGAVRVTATDVNPRAVACARANLDRLGVGERCEVVEADLWPAVSETTDAADAADIVVFNPPWLPGTPTSELELGIYDASSAALRRFLTELTDHLTDGGEGWLVLSDLAEHLGLRTREQLETWISDGGLQVLGRSDTTPRHPKVLREDDPLHVARSREVTSLWRLGRM
jgi:methylase of polypeptide subunit release factors